MIQLDGMVSIPFLKKTVFTGSHKGMNFMLKKESGDDGDCLRAVVWPGPFIFSLTPEEKKKARDFEFSKNGLEEAIRWLNSSYETGLFMQTPGGVTERFGYEEDGGSTSG